MVSEEPKLPCYLIAHLAVALTLIWVNHNGWLCVVWFIVFVIILYRESCGFKFLNSCKAVGGKPFALSLDAFDRYVFFRIHFKGSAEGIWLVECEFKSRVICICQQYALAVWILTEIALFLFCLFKQDTLF